MLHERYIKSLSNINQNFACEGQVLNFLEGLTTATRTQVEGGIDTVFFYDLYADEAYWQLEYLDGYDYECWNLLVVYSGFKQEAYN